MALERTRGRLAALENAAREPIAIVGLACRVPGADDPAAFWDLLMAGTDAISPVPRDRWDHDAYFGTDASEPGRVATHSGGFIRGVDRFDAAFFGISDREARAMDPQQRLLLEVGWEALEHAGIAPDSLEGTATGVYLGATSNDYVYLQLEAGDPALLDGHYASGIAQSVMSGRLSYLLGLQGPSLTVDTACSSSLVAVHLACQALRSGDCRMALAGGVNLLLSPNLFVSLSRAHMLSPDGRCKTFDAAADGFARSEGCGIVVLKRRSDAVADGDRILALIRGSAVNQDGPSSSLSAPNGPAQEAVLRTALERAGIQPHEVGYVEAHGTGTQLGDPMEMGALGAVFGERRDAPPMLVGSVKTNIGHLEGAAGVAGLIKLVLALQHRTIPAHLHFRQPSPHIPWSNLPFQVPVAATPWPEIAGRRIAGISSFGFSGTNAHVVVEEAPAGVVEPDQNRERPALLALSAQDPAALAELAGRLQATLRDQPAADLIRTLNAGRAQLHLRATVSAETRAGLRDGLEAIATGAPFAGVSVGQVARRDPPRVAFLFTGQGAQYAGMARGLYEQSTVFRDALDRCAAILEPLLERPLLEVIFGDAAALDQTAYTQPALFAVEYALSRLWAACGVEPAIVMGHSVGEYVAACLAGVFGLEDGLRLIARRGQLMQSLPPGGGMAAVAAPAGDLEGLAAASVSIAAINGPAQTVIAGPEAAVRAVCERLAERDITSLPLSVSHAFHSHLVDPVLDAFEASAHGVTFAPPRLRLISNLTGALAGRDTVTSADYWRRHMREPVRFADGVRALAAAAPEVCIEIGPHPVLLGFVKAAGVLEQAALIPSLRRGRPDDAQFPEALGAAFMRGARIDWAPLAEGGRVTDLPTYPFQRRRHWFAAQPRPTPALPPASVPATAGHPLLGEALPVAVPGRFFQARLAADAPAYLRDHAALGRVVLPATAHLEMLAAAAEELRNGPPGAPIRLEDVVIGEAMVLPEEGALLVQTVATGPDPAGWQATISSRAASTPGDPASAPDAGWTRHTTARIRRGLPPESADGESLAEALAACTLPLDVTDFYANMSERGMGFGPSFRGVVNLRRGAGVAANQCLGEIALPDSCAADAGAYHIHPALLDACLQVVAAAIGGPPSELFLPIGFGAVTLLGSPSSRCWSHVTVEGSGSTRRASARVFDADGRPVAAFDDIALRRVEAGVLSRQDDRFLEPWLYRTEWRALPGPAGAPVRRAPRVVILAGASGMADDLAARLPGATISRDGSLRTVFDATDIVDLRPLDAAPGVGAASAFCDTARALLTEPAWARSGFPRLWLVTAGGQSVTGAESVLSPSQAAAWGVARTIRSERAELPAFCLDLDPHDPAGSLEALVAELHGEGAEPEVAIRAGRRSVSRLARFTLGQRTSRPDLTKGGTVRDGTYLITGGNGGVGLQVAAFLAENGAGRLVLAGRRGETAESAPVVARLRAGGTTVLCEALDVADEASLGELLARLRRDGPPLRGVVHAAAVLDNAALLVQDAGYFERVAAPKLGGAEALDRLTRPDPLDFFVLFSSIAGVLGAPGQVNYAAANAALDVLAARRRRDGLPACTVAWGAWAQAGAAANDRTAAWVWDRGMESMTTAQGLRALARFAAGDLPAIVVAPVDWARYVERVCGGATPAFLREIADARHATGRTVPETSAHSAGASSLPERLAAAPPAGRRALLESFVRERVSRALGTDPARPLDDNQPLGEAGLDSLLAIELRNALGAALERPLPATLLFDYPTIAALTEVLLAELFGPSDDTVATTSQGTPPPLSIATQLIGAVADLSDEQVERQLAARLSSRDRN
jgi:acyl transferase domain-containing protein/acyl carrier protein